ncbi:hypothetical protein ACTZWT_22860 [Rhodopseudomonas sp. NSM]|uniref:hypothetical protein n=1 Tax=Rhodopseudomonas sp. NSM TaxID=3457630 RepID=UPI0040375E6F
MTQISRVFDNPGRANAALDDLKARGFGKAELAAGPEGRGKTLLRVDAPFGTAVQVEDILDRHAKGTARGANGAAPVPAAAAKPAAPSSRPAVAVAPTPPQAGSQLGRPAAPAGGGTPAAKPQVAQPSASARDGARSGPRTLSQLLGIPELIDSNTFFSGFPLLIRPAPKRTEQPPAKPN